MQDNVAVEKFPYILWGGTDALKVVAVAGAVNVVSVIMADQETSRGMSTVLVCKGAWGTDEDMCDEMHIVPHKDLARTIEEVCQRFGTTAVVVFDVKGVHYNGLEIDRNCCPVQQLRRNVMLAILADVNPTCMLTRCAISRAVLRAVSVGYLSDAELIWLAYMKVGLLFVAVLLVVHTPLRPMRQTVCTLSHTHTPLRPMRQTVCH